VVEGADVADGSDVASVVEVESDVVTSVVSDGVRARDCVSFFMI
jgi:hypothetical protein